MLKKVIFIGLLIPFSLNIKAEIYTFGVVPQQSAKKLAQLWTPILRHINEKTGHTLQLKTAKDIPTFEQRNAAGEYDFSYMNPYHYTEFSQSPGYIAIAKRKNQKIKGIIVVRKDSSVSSLPELDGGILAFPSPAAFAASILPQTKLRSESVTFKPQYVSSHDSVYLGVAKGLFPAGGGVKRTLNNLDANTRAQLRVLWETEAYTPHAFAAHPRVPETARALIQKALLEINSTPEGNSLLKKIKIKHGIEAATDSDWDDVRKLNIQLIGGPDQAKAK